MSLIDAENFETLTELTSENGWAFYSLFSDTYNGNYSSEHILSHPEKKLVLPATTLAQSCCAHMFENCTSLTIAPELPATTLTPYCYEYMFIGCSSLTTAPELPATTLANSCYQYMFSVCTSLMTAPELPATTLADYCYYAMFAGCTNLSSAPALPATTLANGCYQRMFGGCTSLTTAPVLPATTLTNWCYSGMFHNCVSLRTVPQNMLPATTLADNCYSNMFFRCTNLTQAPILPAITLVRQCYQYMFQNCTSLSSITCNFVDWFSNDYSTYYWVENVAPTGDFYCNDLLSEEYDVSKIPNGWNIHRTQSISSNLYITTNTNSTTIGLNCKSTYQKMWYSLDNITWNEYTNPIFISEANINLYLIGVLNGDNTSSNYTQFSISGGVSLHGNLNYLFGATSGDLILRPYCGYSLFGDCNEIIDVSDLTLCTQNTILSTYCYYSMFMNCMSITTPPSLPSTTLAHSSYRCMFYRCSSLTTAPELPVPTLDNTCTYCYAQMFDGCTNLNYIKCLATEISSSSCTSEWVNGVQTNSGTFIKHPDMSGWQEGINGIPSGWTVVNA